MEDPIKKVHDMLPVKVSQLGRIRRSLTPAGADRFEKLLERIKTTFGNQDILYPAEAVTPEEFSIYWEIARFDAIM